MCVCVCVCVCARRRFEPGPQTRNNGPDSNSGSLVDGTLHAGERNRAVCVMCPSMGNDVRVRCRDCPCCFVFIFTAMFLCVNFWHTNTVRKFDKVSGEVSHSEGKGCNFTLLTQQVDILVETKLSRETNKQAHTDKGSAEQEGYRLKSAQSPSGKSLSRLASLAGGTQRVTVHSLSIISRKTWQSVMPVVL